MEEVACWIRNKHTGEEKRLEATSKAARPTMLAVSPPTEDLPLCVGPVRLDEHRRSYSSMEGFPVSSSLNALQALTLHNTHGVVGTSPQSMLISSIPSSPSLPTFLGRLSACSTSGGESPLGERSPKSPAAMLESKRKRLSGQYALKYGDDIQRQQRKINSKSELQLIECYDRRRAW